MLRRDVCYHALDLLLIVNGEIGTNIMLFFLRTEMLQTDPHDNPELLKLAREAESVREHVVRDAHRHLFKERRRQIRERKTGARFTARPYILKGFWQVNRRPKNLRMPDTLDDELDMHKWGGIISRYLRADQIMLWRYHGWVGHIARAKESLVSQDFEFQGQTLAEASTTQH